MKIKPVQYCILLAISVLSPDLWAQQNLKFPYPLIQKDWTSEQGVAFDDILMLNDFDRNQALAFDDSGSKTMEKARTFAKKYDSCCPILAETSSYAESYSELLPLEGLIPGGDKDISNLLTHIHQLMKQRPDCEPWIMLQTMLIAGQHLNINGPEAPDSTEATTWSRKISAVAATLMGMGRIVPLNKEMRNRLGGVF